MVRRSVSGSESSNNRRRHKKASPGLQIKERDGSWHIVGTLRACGRSVRVRRSTELPAKSETREAAETIRLRIEKEIRDEAIHGVRPSVAVALAARDYLTRPRERPLSISDINTIKHVVREFGTRILREIGEREWDGLVRRRMEGRKASTRERYLNTILAFLSWCAARPRGYLEQIPAFDRDKKARNPNTRARRRVADISPELLQIMLDHAAPHLRAQIAVELSTGGRVSSVLHGCRLCDVILAEGREQITFHDTKNGDMVTAALHPRAAEELRSYLAFRGNLHDREGALFLTGQGKPYAPGRGTQNKTAFNAMKRRAIKAIGKEAADKARALHAAKNIIAAKEVIAAARDHQRLVGQITQHWFRHLLADRLLKSGADIRTVMAQGGWRDPKSVMGYTRDVEAHRRQMVRDLPLGDCSRSSKDEESA